MIIEKILGNLHELPPGPDPYFGLHKEKVVLPSAQLVKRIQRVTTDHGQELGIRLPAGSGDLRDGDILHVADANMIVVSVLPTDVLVIAPRTIHEMGVVAHSLGNRHLQAQFFEASSDYGADVMVCQYDHTVEDYLKHVGVPYDRQERVMPVPSAMPNTATSFLFRGRGTAPDLGLCPPRGAPHTAAPRSGSAACGLAIEDTR
ncbi:urease accessory protein UreE [Arthrobacter sp. Hiyo6]|nr:urease accessory protein UreE [Arthrobacter sp. Hiyo6]